jgi:uncharacterized protein YbbC (DUF1343 family)
MQNINIQSDLKNTKGIMKVLAYAFAGLLIGSAGCSAQSTTAPQRQVESRNSSLVTIGSQRLDLLLPKLLEKRVALVVNNTSLLGKTHLADTLKSAGVNIRKIFAPEHGFRGTAGAGEEVKDGVDVKTGLQLVSLYGSNRKPTSEQLADVEVVIFDIQDVGVRFYTYISTMHYVMEACAEQEKRLIILDRPNPNGFVDGPVLEPQFRSFLGMHTIPLVHGLTVGELALMINGEGWLGYGKKCDVEVITLQGWKHQDPWSITVKPSPNLPNDQAIRLYPSIGMFEGIAMSVGRGTQMPFQVLGHPDMKNMTFQFTPVTIEGMAKNPLYENKLCYGVDLRNVTPLRKIDLQYVMSMYKAYPDKEKFFNARNFDTHVGNSTLREQITQGLTEDQIRQSWQKDLAAYHKIRNRYLLYP